MDVEVILVELIDGLDWQIGGWMDGRVNTIGQAEPGGDWPEGRGGEEGGEKMNWWQAAAAAVGGKERRECRKCSGAEKWMRNEESEKWMRNVLMAFK